MVFKWVRLTLLSVVIASGVHAEEGMWTFDNIPRTKMLAKYGFAPDQAWLDHVQLSALRFPGGSGSFVSKTGLVLTNHHVGRGSIQQVSGPGKDYIKNGFYAVTQEQEIRVPGLELRTLISMTNITDRLNTLVKGKDDKTASTLRDESIAAIVQEMNKKTGLDCQSVRLYQGGEYWIYAYKVHKDVRLVFAPEEQIAFFGGDPDNFTYPRHDLDFSIFRVYENNKPYNPSHYLTWSEAGIANGDLTFVIGHPGSTSRLLTFDQMSAEANVTLPLTLSSYARRLAALRNYGKTSEEAARKITTTVFSIENDQKRTIRYAETLNTPASVSRLKAQEAALRAAVIKDASLAYAKDSWGKISKAQDQLTKMAKEIAYVNTRNSALLSGTLTLVRYASEKSKPDADRLPMFKEANIKRTLTALTNGPGAIDMDLERVNFTVALEEAQEGLGSNHPFIKKILAGRTPAAAVDAALSGSTLMNAEQRKALVDGGVTALVGSQDPMVQIAMVLDPLNRAITKKASDLQAIIREQNGFIARARFAVYGKELYPDATFTLRLTYGPIETYPANGTKVQPFTTIAGLYDRAWGWGPKAENGAWALPETWLKAIAKVNMQTPFNFVHSTDIIGGNSGSPVTNVKGELVGLIFDGNIESLPGKYIYDGIANRAVSVDARVIIEALRNVYGASPLAMEITGR